jgi:hypothetical protein
MNTRRFLHNNDQKTVTQTDIDRGMYSELRQSTGAPAMLASRFGGKWYVETRDGEPIAEQHEASNAWAAKCHAVLAWSEKQDQTDRNP